MMKLNRYFLIVMAACMCGLTSVSCEDYKKTEAAPPDPVVAEATYLLYLVGQNNLSTYLNQNITDILQAYGKMQQRANILVYADISSAPELYLIDKDVQGNVSKKTVKTYPDQYSVDPDVMREVINYVFTSYPAVRKGVTLSSHADGSLYSPTTVKRSFGLDGSYNMNITDLAAAFQGCPYLDFIMFDACMMSNVETAYELKDAAHYLLASPNSVPGNGYPYAEILEDLLGMDAEGLVRVAKTYMEHYHQNTVKWDDFVAICVSDLSAIGEVALYTDSLLQDKKAQGRANVLSRSDIQMFETGKNLYDFVQMIDSVGKDNVYLPALHNAMKRVVVYEEHGAYASCTDWGNLILPISEGTCCGMTTYLPPLSLYAEMQQRSFFTTTAWYRKAGFWRVPVYNQYDASRN